MKKLIFTALFMAFPHQLFAMTVAEQDALQSANECSIELLDRALAREDTDNFHLILEQARSIVHHTLDVAVEQEAVDCARYQLHLITAIVARDNAHASAEKPHTVADSSSSEGEEPAVAFVDYRDNQGPIQKKVQEWVDKGVLELSAGLTDSRGSSDSRTISLGVLNEITSEPDFFWGKYGFRNEFEWLLNKSDVTDNSGVSTSTDRAILRDLFAITIPDNFLVDEAYIDFSRNQLDAEVTKKTTVGLAKYLYESDHCSYRTNFGIGRQRIEFDNGLGTNEIEDVVEFGNRYECDIWGGIKVSAGLGADWGSEDNSNIFYRFKASKDIRRRIKLEFDYIAQDRWRRANPADEGFDRTFTIKIVGHFSEADLVNLDFSPWSKKK